MSNASTPSNRSSMKSKLRSIGSAAKCLETAQARHRSVPGVRRQLRRRADRAVRQRARTPRSRRSSSMAIAGRQRAHRARRDQRAACADRPGAARRHPPPRRAMTRSASPRLSCRNRRVSAMTTWSRSRRRRRAASARHLGALVAEGNRHRRAAGPPLSQRQPPHRQQSRRARFRQRIRHRRRAGRRPIPSSRSKPGIRVDLPSDLPATLLDSATEAVRRKLLSARRRICSRISAARSRQPPPSADREMSVLRDFAAAKRFVAAAEGSRRTQRGDACSGFAKQQRYEETVPRSAELSNSSFDVIRPLMQSLARRRSAGARARRRSSAGR